MELIDKSKLLEGLKKLKQNLSASPLVVIEDVESLVESLETKEVDLDKACKWLKENKEHPFIGCEDCCLSGYLTDEFIEEFKKAMEDKE